MEQTYYYETRHKIFALLICSIVFGVLIVASIEDTKVYEAAYKELEMPVYSANTFDLTGYFEQKAYDRALSRYHIRLIRSFILLCSFIVTMFIIIRPRKIMITSDGIYVYSIFRRKAYLQQKWKQMHAIHMGFGRGWHGLMGRYGVHLYSSHKTEGPVFIKTQHYRDESSIYKHINEIMKGRCEITCDQVDQEPITPLEMITVGYSTLKKNYKTYYVYSIIFSVFLFLHQYFKESPIVLIAAVSFFMWGYRALGALNHHVYCDYNGIANDFDKSWDYSRTQIGRLIGATAIQSIAGICIALALISMHSQNLNLALKYVLMFIFLLGSCVWTVKFMLLPYIASIINTQESYMSINNRMFKAYLSAIITLSIPLLLKGTMLTVALIMKFDDINHGMQFIGRLVYCSLFFEFMMTPFYATCAMYLLKTLPNKLFAGGIEHEEVL